MTDQSDLDEKRFSRRQLLAGGAGLFQARDEAGHAHVVAAGDEFDRLLVIDTPERLAALEAARRDVCDAGRIARLELEAGAVAAVRVELAPVAQS